MSNADIAVNTKLSSIGDRADIFEVENDNRIVRTILVFIILGILLGVWFKGREIIVISSSFMEILSPDIAAKLVMDLPEEKKPEKKKKKKKQKTKVDKSKKNQLIKSKTQPKDKPNRGVGAGDIRQKVTQKGLLAIISGKSNSRNAIGSNAMLSSFSTDLDQVLESVGGLKTSGNVGFGRAGLSGKKFNSGYAGSGGAGGIDDLLDNMAGQMAKVKRGRAKRQITLPTPSEIIAGGGLNGRNPKDIYRVVMQHIGGLQHEYNKRLRNKPGLGGKITVRFIISQSGKVVMALVISDKIRDSKLKASILRRIKTWNFGRCKKAGNATVTFPFSFAN